MAVKKKTKVPTSVPTYQDMISDYDPNQTVGVRSYLTHQYGMRDEDIGWRPKDDGGVTVTLKGYDFMNVDKDQLYRDRSYRSLGDVQNAIQDYSKKYGYDFNKSSDPSTRNYQPNSQYKQEIDRLYKQITNTPKFEYNPEDDPLYQSYKEQYTRQGDKAMQNTMAEASALSGGRNNSWATTAGAQANNEYMQKLNAQIPALANQAYNQYNQDLQNKIQAFNTANALENQNYNRFMNERNYDLGIDQSKATGMAEAAKSQEAIRQFNEKMNQSDRQFNNKMLQDQKQFDATLGFNREKMNTSNKLEQTKMAIQQAYNQGRLSVDQANSALRGAELEYKKQQDAINNEFKATELDIKKAAQAEKAEEDVLGIAYKDMMTSGDPKQWLIDNAEILKTEELKALERLIPDEDAEALIKKLLGN